MEQGTRNKERGALLPEPTSLSRPFWDGLRQHKLVMQACLRCGDLRWTPTEFCLQCQAPKYEWRELSGRGMLLTYTVVHRGAPEPLKRLMPYVVAVIELKEGPKILTNLVQFQPEDLRVGLPVQIVYDVVNEEVTVPKFRPAASP